MSDDKSACAKCGDAEPHPFHRYQSTARHPFEPTGGTRFSTGERAAELSLIAPAPDKGAGLTREEYAELLLAYNNAAFECGEKEGDEFYAALSVGRGIGPRLLAHDAALRAEVERYRSALDGQSELLNETVARVATLEKAIRDAPHNASCPRFPGIDYGRRPCDCWKRAALEGK